MTRRLRFLLILLTHGFLAAAATLSAVPASVQALATAGGRFANLDNASVVLVSTANIARMGEAQMLINATVWSGDIHYDSNSGASLRMSESWIIPGRLVFGIGTSTAFGMATKYPKDMDQALKYPLACETRLLAIVITPSLAYNVTDTLSIAAGLDIIYSEPTIRRAYPWGLWAGFGTPDGELSFRGSGWGVGGYAGANWTIAKGQRLAVEGTLVSSLKTDVTFPASIAVGYGIDFIGRLTPGFDFQWSKKSSHEDIPTNVDKCQVLLADNHVALIGWKSSIDLGEGITYTLGKHWNLRCGYLFSQNSQAAAPPPRWPSTIALFSAWALAGEASARASICPTHFYTTPSARSAETPRRSSTGVTSTSGNSFSSVSRIVSNHQIAHS